MRATILSCMASGLLGYRMRWPRARPRGECAADSCDSAFKRARVMIVAQARLSNTCVPRRHGPPSLKSASEQAGEPYSGRTLWANRGHRRRRTPTWYCTAVLAGHEHGVAGDIDTQVNVAPRIAGQEQIAHAPAPARGCAFRQPMTATLIAGRCARTAWAAAAHSGVLNWASAVGCIRVPTLSSTPRRPASNTSLRPLHPGAKAHLPPTGQRHAGAPGGSSVLVRQARCRCGCAW